MATCSDITLHSCEICGEDGLREDELRKHLNDVHLVGENSCPFCDLGGISPDAMIDHVNSVHMDYLTPDSPGEKDPPNFGFTNHGFERCNGSVPTITIEDNSDEEDLNLNHVGGASGNGSPSRNQLSLNLNERKTRLNMKNIPILVTSEISCPICGIKESSPQKMEEHVNRAHFDLTSPSFPPATPSKNL